MDTIETQFNVGDTVYVLMHNSIWHPEITRIDIKIDVEGTSIRYWLSAGDTWHKAKDLHTSKEELASHWLAANEIKVGEL